MKIERRMSVADKVVKQLEVVLAKHPEVSKNAWLECYKNGRENGYALVYWLGTTSSFRKAVFSEYRNSDNIVVYLGDSIGQFGCGNVPSEEVYASRKMFPSTSANKVACSVVRWIRGV